MTKGYKNITKESERERKKVFYLQKKIEEQKSSLDSSSTSSASTTTETSELSIYQDEENETTMHILDTLYDTLDGSLTDEELMEEEQEYIPKKADINFFENFGELPDITNISEDISVCTIIEEKELVPRDITKDMGHFVDPLTGSEFQSSSVIKVISKETFVSIDDADAVSESQQSEISEILLPDDVLFEETDTTTHANKEDENTQDLLETFLQLDTSKLEDEVDEVDWEAIAKQQEDKLIKHQTLEFISDLVHSVVGIAESISPEVILRKNLDKRKILLELSQAHQQYEVQTKVLNWLNRKVVEFFKRKKQFRSITHENIKTLPQVKQIFKEAIKRLDEFLARKSAVEISTTSTINQIRNEFNDVEQRVNSEVQMFEEMVKKNLFRESSPQLNNQIEQLLRKMAKYRKEVSEVRYRMITKQHTHAILLEKLTKLEDLGNGLTITAYDHIQTENQSMDKKIEERNVDLKKLHIRSRNCLHLLAHYKEKQTMLHDVIATQRSTLYELYDERSSLRKHVYQLKLKRSRIRQEINELSIQGGLLDKPALMYDYDQTVKHLSEVQVVVNRLRITLDTIQQRIRKLEKRLTGDNHNFSMIK